ncbi:MAG: hypothetical protein LUH40_07260 [Clostridiales bacterium]|nr:hypothetical protein [Clostridiales bacterium]
MFGINEAEDLYFATHSKKSGDGFEEQITSFIKEHPKQGDGSSQRTNYIRIKAAAAGSDPCRYFFASKIFVSFCKPVLQSFEI